MQSVVVTAGTGGFKCGSDVKTIDISPPRGMKRIITHMMGLSRGIRAGLPILSKTVGENKERRLL